MKKPTRIGLWWVPLLLVAAPIAGWVPGHRDLIDFFLPMRQATASMLSVGTAPWINLANGCGEAWFANPETAVLYPPAWLHLVFSAPWAMSLEIALHLAWLSLGAGLVALTLGAGRWGRLVVEVVAWSSGPVMVTVGVLNNLETVAWLPWMFLAARRNDHMRVPLLAVATAMAWFGGEPQVWAIAVVLVLLVAPDRLRAGAGVALGTAVVMVQLVPFIFWVIEGDRGTSAAAWALRGGLAPADWSGLLVPGLPWNSARMIYAESLFFGAPLIVCALLGAWRHKLVLAGICILGFIATLPELGGGDFFLLLTGGLVRYPSRFALVALMIVLPLVGRGTEDWLEGRGRFVALAVGLLTLLLCGVTEHPWRWWIAGGPSVLLIVAAVVAQQRLRATALGAGLVGVVIAALPLLGLQRMNDIFMTESVWPEAVESGRLYSPTPSVGDMQWLATGLEPRRLWPVGYLNLTDQLTLVRTDSPVAHGRLAQHLAIVDEGPASRWWLDVLAASWVVLPDGEGVPDGMEETRRRGGLRLLRNLRAMPIFSLNDSPPMANGAVSMGSGGVVSVLSGNHSSAVFTAPEPRFLWLSLAPVDGWHWHLDGEVIEMQQGPGIVQFIPVAGGEHRLEGRYRPPGIVVAGVISAMAFLMVLILMVRGFGTARPQHLIP